MRLLCIILIAGSIFAQDPGTMDQDTMMKQWMEFAAPDANHKLIEAMAGSWKATGKFRMMPDQPWETFTSTAEHEMILGGRFLQTKAQGNMMGMPFEGFGLIGYDKGIKKYVSTWGDNFGTMLMSATGTGDLENKKIDLMSEFQDPMTGQMVKMRSTYLIKSEHELVLAMYNYAPDGQEFLSMEIIYTK